LVFFLANWTIEPTSELQSGKFLSRIEVHRDAMPNGPRRLRFRLLTQYADVTTTNLRTMGGQHFPTDSTLLHTFGVFPIKWVNPTAEEIAVGFKAANDLIVPAGYLYQS
jgi:hypothetical protein